MRLIRSHGKMIPMFYKKAKAIANERMIDAALKPNFGGKTIRNDGDTAVYLGLTYYFPHPSGTPKWKRSETTFMTQRPDADNISKAVVDRMTEIGFWQDDSMVNFRFSKFRSSDPHIDVSITVWLQKRDGEHNSSETVV